LYAIDPNGSTCMSESENAISESWEVKGNELDVEDVLKELQTGFPDIRLQRANKVARSLTARAPLRDMSVVDLVITATATTATKFVLDKVYAKLIELVQRKDVKVRKKRKRKK
jgi:hypothetical protein